MKTPDLIYDWNVRGRRRRRATPVEVWDETLRDGLQSPSVRTPSVEKKIQILRLMERMGVHQVDLGLPGAGPHHEADIDALLCVIVSERMRVRPACAVRTVVADIEPLARLQDRHGIPIVAAAFVGTSPIRQYVEEWDRARIATMMDSAIRWAVERSIPVLFVTEDTTRSHPRDVAALYRHAIELGARGVCVCDTVGHATPHGVGKLVGFVRDVVASTGAKGIEVHWHGHRDRGLDMANCLAAIEAGADVIHGAALGIGERVGNAPMDQLLVNLRLMGLHTHDLSALGEYCRTVSEAVGVPIPHNYPVVGSDAFETATGVHAAAVIKGLRKGDRWLADRVYSGVPAGDFGLEQAIKVGPMSGRSNVVFWLQRRGIAPTEELVARIFDRAKDSDHILQDAEILSIVARAKASPSPS